MTDRRQVSAAWAPEADAESVIRLQAEHHFSVVTDHFESMEDYCIALLHQRAYDEALRYAKDGRVLDLGCNNGWGTIFLADAGLSAVGVDVSKKMLEEARARSVQHRGRFLEVDGLRLPFRRGAFDLITSFQVIEHIADTRPYIDEITRVLKPGGIAMFTTPNARLRLDPGMTPWNVFHVREFNAPDLHATLRPSFSDVQVLGLFAIDEIYNVERRRVELARQRAREEQGRRLPHGWQVRKAAIDGVKKVLPGWLTQRLRALMRTRQTRSGVAVQSRPSEAAQPAWPAFSSADMFYKSEPLDDALDLLAVCRR